MIMRPFYKTSLPLTLRMHQYLYWVRYCAHVLIIINPLRYHGMIYSRVVLTSRQLSRQVEEEPRQQFGYFRISDDGKSRADCQLCSAKLSRGGMTSSPFNKQFGKTSRELTHRSRSMLMLATGNSNNQLCSKTQK